MDAPFPQELLNVIDILSPNESELARLTGMPTGSFEQIGEAVRKCHEMVSVTSLCLYDWLFSYVMLWISFLELNICRNPIKLKRTTSGD